MAQFFEDLEAFAAQTQYFTGSLSRKFIFDGYLLDDALANPLCPVVGSSIQVAGLTMVARGFGEIRKIRDDAGTIVINYTTANTANPLFKPFHLTYKKVEQRVPLFSRGMHTYMDASNRFQTRARWLPQDIAIQIEQPCLTITVHRYAPGAVSNAAHQADIAAAIKENYHMHNLPYFGMMVMQPPLFDQVSYTNADITYVWLGDPGNPGITIPLQQPVPPDLDPTVGDSAIIDPDVSKFITPPPRPPWFMYVVEPPAAPASNPEWALDGDRKEGKPKIRLATIYGPNNPFVALDGWRALPGGPLS